MTQCPQNTKHKTQNHDGGSMTATKQHRQRISVEVMGRGGYSVKKRILSFLVLALAQEILPPYHAPVLPVVSASGILADLASNINDRLFPAEDYINLDVETKTLSIVEISEMRARDIKRRLARYHGYGADELARMIDKTDLINKLSFEEHKIYQQELERRKWRNFKTTVIYTCVAVMVVMFWPVIKHAWEVAHVNFVVYTGKTIQCATYRKKLSCPTNLQFVQRLLWNFHSFHN
jgi:hypothetical protein